MATRKATKRSTSRTAPKGRKKTARKASPRRKVTAKRASKGGKKVAAKARPKIATPEAVARKIVRMTKDHTKFDLEDLYAEDCVSQEPNQPEPALGHEGLRAKNEFWESFQDSSKADWTAKNIFIKGNTICIEWEAKIVTRDGRSLTLKEAAVHEVKGGKIVAERYYFDSGALQPAAAPARPDPVPTPRPQQPAPPRPQQPASQYTPPSSTPTYKSSFESEGDDLPKPKVDPIDM